jgi:hypothetical protein
MSLSAHPDGRKLSVVPSETFKGFKRWLWSTRLEAVPPVGIVAFSHDIAMRKIHPSRPCYSGLKNPVLIGFRSWLQRYICCDWTVTVSVFGGGVLPDSWGLSAHAGARGCGLWSLRFESCRNLNLNF